MTNNKRNLLPLLHGRTPQGGNVNDIPRDEVDLERKRERESSSKCWKIRLESKKEGLVSFFWKYDFQKLYKHGKYMQNVLLLERCFVNMTHHFVRFESE